MEEQKHYVIETCEVVRGEDSQGHKLINNYTVIKKLGEGSFGKVKLCSKGDELFAMKVYNKFLLKKKRDYVRSADVKSNQGSLDIRNALQDVIREIAIMKKLRHTNVVRLHEVIDDDETDKLYMSKVYIVIDYCSNGPILDWDPDLSKFVSPWNQDEEISEEIIRKIFRDSICGLEYFHRDIKPQNILLHTHGNVKIADFGQAQIFEENDILNATMGTYHFFPPECCVPESTGFSGKAADIWAIGLTLYALIYKRLPFSADTMAGLFDVIQSHTLTFPSDRPISTDLQHLVTRLLDKNPTTRIKMFEILQDPWLNRNSNPLRASPPGHIQVTDEELSVALRPFRSVVIAVISYTETSRKEVER